MVTYLIDRKERSQTNKNNTNQHTFVREHYKNCHCLCKTQTKYLSRITRCGSGIKTFSQKLLWRL